MGEGKAGGHEAILAKSRGKKGYRMKIQTKRPANCCQQVLKNIFKNLLLERKV
jgi:hypothetical protein